MKLFHLSVVLFQCHVLMLLLILAAGLVTALFILRRPTPLQFQQATAGELDLSHHATDPDQRAAAERRMALLTPVIKGFLTDVVVVDPAQIAAVGQLVCELVELQVVASTSLAEDVVEIRPVDKDHDAFVRSGRRLGRRLGH